MKLYKSDGKIFAELNETIELCDIRMTDSLETYKQELLKKFLTDLIGQSQRRL